MGEPIAPESMTPMLRQYFELKEKAAGAVLFFRMGDFYELFGDDAEMIAPVLEIVLTSRERGDQKKIPFCGVPHHSARSYWLKLLKLGYKVAIADQMEDPAEAKGLVRRDITRVMTPGTVDDPEGLEKEEPNYLLAVYQEPARGAWSAALADISTGELRLGQIASEDDIVGLVETYRPKELLARAFYHQTLEATLATYLSEQKLQFESMPEAALRDEVTQNELLRDVLGASDVGAQPCGRVDGGRELLAALFSYLTGLQASLRQFLSVRPLREPDTMALDETARRDLELFESRRRRESEGSLFREVNKTLSPIGARLLRHELAHPLLGAAHIAERHETIACLIDLGPDEIKKLRGIVKGTPDLERITARILSGVAQPHELAAARQGLAKASELACFFSERSLRGVWPAVLKDLKASTAALDLLMQSLVENPGPLGSGFGVFRPGHDAELDELNEISQRGESKVSEYEAKLREETGISSLKVRLHKSFGMLIEVTKANLAKVPSSFIRRQTMVNGERFVTMELRELGDSLAGATERAVARETEAYRFLLYTLAQHKNELRSVSRSLAWLDFFQGLAWLAVEENYCRPEMTTDGTMELVGARHPVVERFTGRHAFVPNDVRMARDALHLLVTGPNMAGKSTVLRQTAVCAVMCQTGSFVPAVKARMPIFDRVFTRVGAADDLARGQSTFMVEMSEAAQILRQATESSLVILDEVGRGTSTTDGLAIASAILEWLALRVKCYTLFATHYHELVPFAESLKNVHVMQTEVIEGDGKITFTHRLIDGASKSSFGIEVARIAGLPEAVLARAREFLDDESAKAVEVKNSRPKLELKKPKTIFEDKGLVVSRGMDDPAVADILRRLEQVKILRTTPLQALNILNELKTILEGGGF